MKIRTVVAVALATLIGGQLVRVFFTIVAWFLRSEVGTVGVIPYAVGPFVAGIALAAMLPASRRFLRGAAVVLVAARLIEQATHASSADLWASLVGVTVFVWLVSTQASKPGFAPGLLLGVGADTAVKAATTSLDLSWMYGWIPLAVVAVLSLAAAVAVWRLEVGSITSPRSWMWLSVGPLLLLLWQIFANQGWVATATGSSEMAVGLVVAGSILGVVAADRVSLSAPAATAVGIVLAVATTGLMSESAEPMFVAGLVLIGWMATGALLGSLPNGELPGRGAAVWTATGLLAFTLLGLLFYTTLDLRLPLGQDQVLMLAAAVVAAVSFAAPGDVLASRAVPLWVPLMLAAVPVALFVIQEPPNTTTDVPLRVMSYNVAQGINVDGQFDPEGIAEVIEASGATVVGLQEVSRSWLIAGSTDTVAWLARRLGMEYAYGSAADGGNVILSRIPLRPGSTVVTRLPKGDTLIERSVVRTELALPLEPLVTVMNTHLQHLVTPGIPDEEKESDYAVIQIPQLETVFDAWDGRQRTVLTGDFNLRPDWVQYRFILQAGWVDGWEAGSGPGYTTEDNGISYRIDYVFHTPDLTAVEAEVIQTGASLDHLPVVVTFEP